jgi:putative acetyltransferase
MNVGTPLVRLLRRGDIPAVIDLFRASVRVVAGRDYTQEQVTAWAPDEIDPEAWARRYDTRQAWIAEIGADPGGFIELEGTQYLDMLYVHPAHQRRGVATALLAQVEAAARRAGADRLYTDASITARPFFERRGFLLVAPQRVVLRTVAFVNFRMEKRLGDRA